MIDEISSGVKRLNEMAHTIQDEIHELTDSLTKWKSR